MILNLQNEQERRKFDEHSKKLLEKKCKVEIKEIKKTRSTRQNSALHLYFTLISNELNEMGAEFNYTGLKGMAISTRYTPDIVKDFFWRPIQETLYKFKSTTKLTTEQINEIVDVISKFFAEKGVNLEFPSIESLINSKY